MDNATFSTALPPLPAYTLRPLPPLISWIPDGYLSLVLLIVAYWAVSLFFHCIDTWDLFPQYRLHTPEELLKRNHATRWEVFRDVIIQQMIQTAFGVGLEYFEPQAMYGKEDYDVAVWAQRLRIAQRAIPRVLSFVGVDALTTSQKLISSYPMLAGALAGGNYSGLVQHLMIDGQNVVAPAFAPWELMTGKFIYYIGIPALQFLLAVTIVDTWQYFLHRAMHMNKTLYVTLHSRHHRLYVPYAYGALYNHPVEGFLLDTLGTGIAYLVSGMTVRQSMWLFTCSTIKTVDDHCGYAFPWDPLQLITSNNAAYHDIHHQSWGIKTNFSQPFFTFWDGLLKTKWKGDTSLKYERSRAAAHRAVKKDREEQANVTAPVVEPKPELLDSEGTPAGKPVSQRRSTRKKASSISEQSGSLKGLRDRVNQNLQGKGRSAFGLESSR